MMPIEALHRYMAIIVLLAVLELDGEGRLAKGDRS